MQRSDSGTDFRQLHVDGLQQSSYRVTMRDASKGYPNSTMFVDVEKKTETHGVLTLYVALDSQFPNVPPRITSTTGKVLRCSPIGSQWDPSRNVLAEAVAEAFVHVEELWGRIRPPTLMSLADQLRPLSEDLLNDIATNPQCLETFAYQLPVCKDMREQSSDNVDVLERAAKTNGAVLDKLAKLRETTRAVEVAVKDNVAALNERREQIDALVSASSSDSIIKLFVKEARTIQQESDETEKRCLSIDPSAPDARKALNHLREQFLAQRVAYHSHELRRRAFAASDRR